MGKRDAFNIQVPTAGGAGRRGEREAARRLFSQDEAQTPTTPPEVSTPRAVATSRTATAAAPARVRRENGKGSRGVVSTPGQDGVASWRVPRSDGKLRSNDKMVIDYLRGRVVDADRMITDEVSMRQIEHACSISHRTAQNTVRRLEMAHMVERLAHEIGSNSGCRYRIKPGAPKSKFNE